MDITQLDYLIMIRLDVSIWSARAKLRQEDLPTTVTLEMPPETVVSLGSKRLFDPVKIKIFNTLKARACGVLDKKCVRFLGGYATHEDQLPGLTQDLSDIADEFEREKANFLAHYVTSSAEWCAVFPEWSHILLNALPKKFEVGAKFSFNWQAFRIRPEQSVATASGNNINGTLANLEYTVYEEAAKAIKDIYNECFADKQVVTKKAFRPLRTLIGKVRGLSFIDTNLVGLEAILAQACDYGESWADDVKHICMIKNFLIACSSPYAIQTMCDEYCDNNSRLESVFDPFWIASTTSVVPTLQVESPLVTSRQQVELPQSPSPVVQPLGVIKNTGLW